MRKAGPPPSPTATTRSPRRSVVPLAALVVALGAAAWLLTTIHSPVPPPAAAPSAWSAPFPAVSVSATLPDGADYTPLFYADAAVSVGTAPTPDGTADRLLIRTPSTDRELHRAPKDRCTQFLGFTTADEVLYWAESAALPNGSYETRLWSAPLDRPAPPTSLTTDAGAAVFFESEYDLVVAGGRLHWVAAPPSGSAETELRSVSLAGGEVTTTHFQGRFRHTAWPWLLSVDDGAPLVLADPQTGERRVVTKSAAEAMACTPAWCRSMVTAGDRHVFDVRHPDGTARARIPGDLTAITVDAAVAGRYELFTEYVSNQVRLVAYDLTTATTRVLNPAVGVTAARAGVVWWADRPTSPAKWMSVDLRT